MSIDRHEPDQMSCDLESIGIETPADLQGSSPIQRAASIQTYLSAVRDVPSVVAVFEDGAAEPTVITLVRGPRDIVAETIYQAQASVLRGFPGVAVDFRIIDVARADLQSLGLSMRKIFGR